MYALDHSEILEFIRIPNVQVRLFTELATRNKVLLFRDSYAIHFLIMFDVMSLLFNLIYFMY